MIGTEQEQDYVNLYRMAKLGFSPNETREIDLDIVQAFVHLQAADEKQRWEKWIKIFSKMFGGK